MKCRALIMLVMLVALPAIAAEQAQLNSITFDRVESRDLFGGLGDNTGPIGAQTEFYINEYEGGGSPIMSLGGKVEADYADLTAYIKAPGSVEPKLCNHKTGACNVCEDCKTKAAILEKFSDKNRAKFKKTLRYIVPFTATEMTCVGSKDAHGYCNALQVRLSNFVNGKDEVRIHYTWPYRYKPGSEPTPYVQGKAYLMKSEDDPATYVCPSAVFGGNCNAATTLDGAGLNNYVVAEKVKL